MPHRITIIIKPKRPSSFLSSRSSFHHVCSHAAPSPVFLYSCSSSFCCPFSFHSSPDLRFQSHMILPEEIVAMVAARNKNGKDTPIWNSHWHLRGLRRRWHKTSDETKKEWRNETSETPVKLALPCHSTVKWKSVSLAKQRLFKWDKVSLNFSSPPCGKQATEIWLEKKKEFRFLKLLMKWGININLDRYYQAPESKWRVIRRGG